jgi:cation diffusion facilitator CzcD-associated flavoprotein CzcO
MTTTHVDVLIVGAGVSGIGTACHLTRDCPGKSYLVLERRDAIGGTWDLYRYPGIRSDSDMLTFGYNFRPWRDTKVLADGPSIRAYVEETAAVHGVTEHIRFGRAVTRAEWSTDRQMWTVEAENTHTGERERYTSNFVVSAAGYYDYDNPYRPQFPGEERFPGPIIHPQFWPEDLDYRGKRVVVIGSGATAVTLVPAMAEDAAHVTMLQRSPTYYLSLPAVDKITAAMQRFMPTAIAYRISRGRNILAQRAIYALAQAQPKLVRRLLTEAARRQAGPDVDPRHFQPKYDPWDQRLCVLPNGDLFRAFRSGKASVVTDEIATFTEHGISLRSGAEIPADIIITATGLRVNVTGGNEILVDGRAVDLPSLVTYKSVLLEGVPNAAIIFGYTNASWTLKADIAAEFICRILKHMDARGYTQVVANATEADRAPVSVLASLNSGYVQRAEASLPRQGTRAPWAVLNNYLRDAVALRYGPLEDGLLQFSTHTPVADTSDLLVG